jgi:hypothetical protein
VSLCVCVSVSVCVCVCVFCVRVCVCCVGVCVCMSVWWCECKSVLVLACEFFVYVLSVFSRACEASSRSANSVQFSRSRSSKDFQCCRCFFLLRNVRPLMRRSIFLKFLCLVKQMAATFTNQLSKELREATQC